MPKSLKLWALGIFVALGGMSLSGCSAPAASDTFEGTWYGYYIGNPLRIDLHKEGDRLTGSASLAVPGETNVTFLVTKADVVDDTLRLKLSGQGLQGPPGVTQEIEIELRIPKGELVGNVSFEQGMGVISLVMSQDAPELAAQFAGTQIISPEEIEEENAQAKSARLRAECTNHLKQLGLRMKMFALESRGERYPKPDRLRLPKEDIYPEYLPDPVILMCPADDASPEEGLSDGEQAQWYFDNSRYWYIGHAVANEEEAQLFLDASRTILQEGDGNLDIDLDAPGRTPNKIFRLREDVARFIITDISQPRPVSHMPSKLPVLVERPGTHPPEGGNVLFMDGHVEYIKYPGKFPMTEAFIQGLMSLDELP